MRFERRVRGGLLLLLSVAAMVLWSVEAEALPWKKKQGNPRQQMARENFCRAFPKANGCESKVMRVVKTPYRAYKDHLRQMDMEAYAQTFDF